VIYHPDPNFCLMLNCDPLPCVETRHALSILKKDKACLVSTTAKPNNQNRYHLTYYLGHQIEACLITPKTRHALSLQKKSRIILIPRQIWIWRVPTVFFLYFNQQRGILSVYSNKNTGRISWSYFAIPVDIQGSRLPVFFSFFS
jgi:dipeptide/tripeptide permease